jgi:hypothetical protein
MPRSAKNKGSQLSEYLKSMESKMQKCIDNKMKSHNGSADWIKQHKFEQQTIRVDQIYSAFPSALTSGFATSQPFFITANGYSLYNASNILVG